MKKQATITAAIARAIQNTPSGSTAGQNGNTKVIAELRFPKGKGSFLIFEGTHQRGEKWDGDSVFAWKSELGSTYEIERVSLKELQERRVEMPCSFGTYEAKIERNAAVDVKKRTLADVMGAFAPAAFAPSAAPEVKDAAPAPQPPEKDAAAPSAPVELASNFDTPQDAPETPQDAPAKRTRKSAGKRTTPRKDAQDAPAAVPAPSAVKTDVPAPKRTQKRKDAPAKDDAPAAPEVVGKWEPDVWTRLAKSHPVEARAAAAAWAATDATAERDELMGLVSDYLFLASGNADAEIVDALERDGLDYRGQLDAELSERVRRVYGPEKWEQIAACF